jgi:hypothetical protein
VLRFRGTNATAARGILGPSLDALWHTQYRYQYYSIYFYFSNLSKDTRGSLT